MTTVVGLDLSLTGTGLCVMAPERPPMITVIKSKAAGPTIALRRQRLSALATAVMTVIDTHGVGDLVFVVEQPAYAQTQGSQHDRSGLWWLIVDDLCEYGPVTEVSPTALKKYAVGKGNASKEEVMWRAATEFPGIEAIDDNGCDALFLAAMGRAYVDPDTALHTVTKARSAVLKGVAWASISATTGSTSTSIPPTTSPTAFEADGTSDA